MVKIKRYLDCYIDTKKCNFKCEYCYIAQLKQFDDKLFKADRSPKDIRKALSVERLGGICLINLCAGGETLLAHDVLLVIKELVDEGHYVMVVTNGTVTKHLKEICDTFSADERKHIFFKFSFHYMELKRLNLMEQYFDNVRMMRDAGCSFTCELTPYDKLLPFIEDIKETVTRELGANCHITIARDDRTNGINHLSDMDWDEYKKTWSVFDSELFNFKKSIFYVKRNEFCYAGDWSMWINLSTGDYRPCNCGKFLGNIYEDGDINFRAIGRCKIAHCYNGHSWLVCGVIPNFTNVTYTEERDRVSADGKHWLTEEYQDVFKLKLEDNNKEYSWLKKNYVLGMDRASQIKQKIKHKIGK